MKETKKKVAIVTGGTRGIGKSISLKLAKEGFKVLALYARDRKSACDLVDNVGRDLDILAFRADLTKQDHVDAFINEVKEQDYRINRIIHCAASGVHKPILETTGKHLRWTMEVNVFSFHELLIELLGNLADDCRLIGLTSIGSRQAIKSYGTVGVSKGALDSLFRHYANEFSDNQKSAILVSPGLIETDAVKAFPDPSGRVDIAKRCTPTRKLTSVNDIAELISFLCTNEAAIQFNGHTLNLDGGISVITGS